jgi:hypothetical protein
MSINAAALLIEAAKRSGFLKSIAEVLWWRATTPGLPSERDPAEALIEELMDLFDDNCCLPRLVFEKLTCEGNSLDISGEPPEVIEPFLGA